MTSVDRFTIRLENRSKTKQRGDGSDKVSQVITLNPFAVNGNEQQFINIDNPPQDWVNPPGRKGWNDRVHAIYAGPCTEVDAFEDFSFQGRSGTARTPADSWSRTHYPENEAKMLQGIKTTDVTSMKVRIPRECHLNYLRNEGCLDSGLFAKPACAQLYDAKDAELLSNLRARFCTVGAPGYQPASRICEDAFRDPNWFTPAVAARTCTPDLNPTCRKACAANPDACASHLTALSMTSRDPYLRCLKPVVESARDTPGSGGLNDEQTRLLADAAATVPGYCGLFSNVTGCGGAASETVFMPPVSMRECNFSFCRNIANISNVSSATIANLSQTCGAAQAQGVGSGGSGAGVTGGSGVGSGVSAPTAIAPSIADTVVSSYVDESTRQTWFSGWSNLSIALLAAGVGFTLVVVVGLFIWFVLWSLFASDS